MIPAIVQYAWKEVAMNIDDYAVKIKAAATALRAHQERPFVPHEWEELVAELCRTSDPRLRERMIRELADIKVKDPFFKPT